MLLLIIKKEKMQNSEVGENKSIKLQKWYILEICDGEFLYGDFYSLIDFLADAEPPKKKNDQWWLRVGFGSWRLRFSDRLRAASHPKVLFKMILKIENNKKMIWLG